MMPNTLLAALLALLAQTTSTAGESSDAKAVWERMIEAKGGRATLESVHTLLVSETYTWRQLFVRHRIEGRALYRFPDFTWSWFDNGVPTLGIGVSQSYPDRGYSLYVTGPSAHPKIIRENLSSKFMPYRQIPVLLLETRWMKPTLLGCSITGWTMILQARFEGIPYSYLYYLQKESELPQRVDMPEAEGTHIYILGDYRQTSGLMLPSTFRGQFGSLPSPTYAMKYQINPDYDPQLPSRDPSVEAGPDAWRNPAASTNLRHRP